VDRPDRRELGSMRVASKELIETTMISGNRGKRRYVSTSPWERGTVLAKGGPAIKPDGPAKHGEAAFSANASVCQNAFRMLETV
jgi:hypothetical protein